MYIRLRASESEAFLTEKAKMEAEIEKRKAPAIVLFRDYKKPLLIAIFGRFAEAGNYYLFTTFVLSYVTTTLGVPRSYGLIASMVGAAANVVMIPVFGRLSDRIGRSKTFLIGGGIIVVTSWPISPRPSPAPWCCGPVEALDGHRFRHCFNTDRDAGHLFR